MHTEEILKTLESLLRRYDFTIEANTVSSILSLLAHDKHQAFKRLVDKSWWVGEDAVAEVDLGIAGGFTKEARSDQDKFLTLIIKLYQILQREGYQSDYAQLITNQFNKWLVSRM